MTAGFTLTVMTGRSYNPDITNLRGTTLTSEPGKRYACSNCGSEFVVTRAGEGTISCCDRPTIKKT